jgi:hypothetical protein
LADEPTTALDATEQVQIVIRRKAVEHRLGDLTPRTRSFSTTPSDGSRLQLSRSRSLPDSPLEQSGFEL